MNDEIVYKSGMFGGLKKFIRPEPIRYINTIKKASVELTGVKSARLLFRQVDHDLGVVVENHKNQEVKSESFEDAVRRFNLTEADIESRHTQFKWMGRIYFVGFLAAITCGLIFDGILPKISGIGLSMIPLSLWFRWSFRSWQVRIRRLGSPKEFVNESGWFAEAFR